MLREEKQDLLAVDTKKYCLVHCVSGDGALGAGIAFSLADKYAGLRTRCREAHPGVGDAVLYEQDGVRIYNLITKEFCYQKPTYFDFTSAMITLRSILSINDERFVAMPRIGCGIDGLEWSVVRGIIEDTLAPRFSTDDKEVEILVCNWNVRMSQKEYLALQKRAIDRVKEDVEHGN